MSKPKSFLPILITLLIFGGGFGPKNLFAQGQSSWYIPLIGITSVPDPLALPQGPGNVTYHYAVKNFISEVPLSNIQVLDDKCSPVKFTGGDDNHNSELDYNETWRYACTTKLSTTTESTSTVTGTANNITATHNASATVVVGSKNPAPLISVVNVTKVAYPLSLPAEGGAGVTTGGGTTTGAGRRGVEQDGALIVSVSVVTVPPKAKALPAQFTVLPTVMPASSITVPAKVELAPRVTAPVGVQNTSQADAPVTFELATVVNAPFILKIRFQKYKL